MIDQIIVNQFSAALQPLLMSELTAGNEIKRTYQDWPEKGSFVVLLMYPFKFFRDVKRIGLRYHSLNDRKVWKAEYQDPKTGHRLACAFG
ncbi:MAG TPA: hypothetical protein DCE41_14930 [Cytophagales bacterium]|nr:hypothetical protein [Cytophagales bacterium]HAA24054.1 hypothetical protein [Cytophagales bacterium]HAP64705.1 hypothetical protein [Cytophagales bacterium]